MAAPIRSVATTHAVAMTGSPATIHPIPPPPAWVIMQVSAGLGPPSQRRIESRKTALVRTTCAAAMIRLHDAPSARCDRHTTIHDRQDVPDEPGPAVRPSAAANRVADIRDRVRDAHHAGEQAEDGCNVDHRL